MGDLSERRPDPSRRHLERDLNEGGDSTQFVRNEGPESTEDSTGAPQIPKVVEEPQQALFAFGDEVEPRPTTPVPVSRRRAPESTAMARLAAMVPKDERSIADAHTSTLPNREKVRRSRWLVASTCVLALLLVVAIGLLVHQRFVANKWMNDYHSEVDHYHAVVHKNIALFASLVTTQSQKSNLQLQVLALANQKQNAALHDKAVLTTALQDAGTVANGLNSCVNGVSSLLNDVVNNLSPTSSFVSAVSQICTSAQVEESALQQTLTEG